MFFIINYFKQKPAILVFFITFLVYSPLLLNHFVGDDNIIIGRNTFYGSWKNVPRLFEKGYISNIREINFNSESKFDFGPGSVSYRPVSNLTYFLDHYLFGAKPYGSHLINILIHCGNSVLVYGIVNQIFSSSILGVFAGLLFSLHPIESEAVAVMSYRADMVAAMFALCSFYFWIRFKQGGYTRKKYYYGSWVMCFLALFSKESAFVLPFVILLFDQISVIPRQSLKQRGIYYIGFILILIFYLYLYFVIFPNASLSFHWLGGSFVNHCLIMGYIWYNYLINVLMPWTVKLIPRFYCPPAPGIVSLVTAEIGIAFIALISSIFVLWRNYKEAVFFLLWYIIFYLPVSDLIPIANPMACRFMYLPSIGLLIVLAFFLHKIFKGAFIKEHSQYLSNILHGAVILICVTRTLFLNGDWKSNFDVGWAWVRDYPADGQGYALMGRGYLDAGSLEKARGYLEKSLLLGDQLPGDALALGACYMRLGEFQASEALLKQIIARFPDYADPFFNLGEIYYDQKHYLQAQEMLEKALMLNPKRSSGYVLLMKVYRNLHKLEAEKDLLKKAGLYLNAQNSPVYEQLL